MAVVYTVIAAFENTVREFVSRVLLDGHGEAWWETCVSEKVRKRAETRREDEQNIVSTSSEENYQSITRSLVTSRT
jgi:hypothetical protein